MPDPDADFKVMFNVWKGLCVLAVDLMERSIDQFSIMFRFQRLRPRVFVGSGAGKLRTDGGVPTGSGPKPRYLEAVQVHDEDRLRASEPAGFTHRRTREPVYSGRRQYISKVQSSA